MTIFPCHNNHIYTYFVYVNAFTQSTQTFFFLLDVCEHCSAPKTAFHLKIGVFQYQRNCLIFFFLKRCHIMLINLRCFLTEHLLNISENINFLLVTKSFSPIIIVSLLYGPNCPCWIYNKEAYL